FAPGSGTVVNASNLAGTDFSVNLSGLTPGQIYYYYAFASNSGGTSYSSQLNFTTFGVPTKLVIISVSPASPIALTPFSVTVQAQDNAGNPVEVPTETDIVLNQFAGSGVFTFPNAPLEAGTLFEGNSTVTITDVSYSIVENNVALTATASTGMTGLGTSVPFYFNVIAYTGPNNFIWSNAGGSTWLTGSNWLPGTAPGSTTTPGTNAHLASFTSQANLLTSAVGGCGINMNTANGVLNVGAIYFAETYNFAHTGDVVYLGNNSTTQDGTLYLYGTALNTVGGISGNNYASLLLANYMNNATTKTLEIRNTMGGGSKFMTLNIANAGSIVAGVGRTINLHTYMTGSGNITFAGGGTFSMNPSGFASVNTYSGSITVANGILLVGNTG
ncbi:MAG TPA: hypothetical protein PKK69_10710, partial [Ferruginibacter sp.]|nr:hypothetical protein [Ferruginibacter sp.]